MSYLSQKINGVTVLRSIFTKTSKFDKCPPQARYLNIYPEGMTHAFFTFSSQDLDDTIHDFMVFSRYFTYFEKFINKQHSKRYLIQTATSNKLLVKILETECQQISLAIIGI